MVYNSEYLGKKGTTSTAFERTVDADARLAHPDKEICIESNFDLAQFFSDKQKNYSSTLGPRLERSLWRQWYRFITNLNLDFNQIPKLFLDFEVHANRNAASFDYVMPKNIKTFLIGALKEHGATEEQLKLLKSFDADNYSRPPSRAAQTPAQPEFSPVQWEILENAYNKVIRDKQENPRIEVNAITIFGAITPKDKTTHRIDQSMAFLFYGKILQQKSMP